METLLEPVWSAAKGPGATSPARSEVQGHLLLSFGNQGRLDYGTGHEVEEDVISWLLFVYSVCHRTPVILNPTVHL